MFLTLWVCMLRGASPMCWCEGCVEVHTFYLYMCDMFTYIGRYFSYLFIYHIPLTACAGELNFHTAYMRTLIISPVDFNPRHMLHFKCIGKCTPISRVHLQVHLNVYTWSVLWVRTYMYLFSSSLHECSASASGIISKSPLLSGWVF